MASQVAAAHPAANCSPVASSGRLGFFTPISRRPQHSVRRRPAFELPAASISTIVTGPTAEGANTGAAVADVWASFADNVSGEWEGATASFQPDGSAIPLPDYYVPEAYRDWGVELFDWQSQSSMLAGAEGLSATSRRMMPTVGCEADAIAFTQEACQLLGPGSGMATVAADGSYSHGPHDISGADCFKVAFEQCLVLQPRQRRLRVLHTLRRTTSHGRWVLDNVELHHERYESPYRGKVELLGCGGGMRGFAADPRLGVEALHGSWAASGVRYTVDASDGQCSCEAVNNESWSLEGLQTASLLLHPLQAWSMCSIQGEDVSMAAGVLLDEEGSSMALATRQLVAGRLVLAELLTLSRTSG